MMENGKKGRFREKADLNGEMDLYIKEDITKGKKRVLESLNLFHRKHTKDFGRMVSSMDLE